jgi:hypothetical protein
MFIKDNIYLTMTTLPERLISRHFLKVYLSLKKQRIPFYRLIINLSVKQFKYKVPLYLRKDPRVIINPTDICGPCAKLLGSVDIIPDDSVVIVLDDDIIVKPNFIGSLYKSYLINPNKVSSNNIIQHEKFKEVMGFAGYIFNINKLKNIKEFYPTMPKCCFKIDDTWISWCINKLGVEVVKSIVPDAWNQVLNIQKTNLHPNWYELNKHTNREFLTKIALRVLN